MFKANHRDIRIFFSIVHFEHVFVCWVVNSFLLSGWFSLSSSFSLSLWFAKKLGFGVYLKKQKASLTLDNMAVTL